MIIESIHMKNFKSHTNTKIEFNTGISIIMGGNGAGKSSILEAVGFALFKQHSSKKIDQLITIGNNKNKMFVKLEFTSNGKKYSVRRERTKTSSKANIMVKEGQNFHQLASGDNQVTKEIQNILEMDGDLFLNAVYVRQGEIADLVDKTPAEKKQVIGKLLGLESLEKAWKNILPLINNYEMEKIRLEGKLETLDNINNDINLKNTEKLDLNRNIEELSSKIQHCQSQLKLITKEKQKLDNNKTLFVTIKSSLESKKQILNNLKEDETHLKIQLNDIKNKENEIETILPRLPRLKSLIRYSKLVENLKKIQENETQTQTIVEKIHFFKDQIERNEKYYLAYSNLEDEINKLEKERTDFEGSKALLKQNYTRKQQIIEKMEISHDKIVKILKKNNKIIGTNFSLIEEFESYINSKKPVIEKLIEEVDIKINKFKEEISTLKTQNQDFKKPISELEYIKEKCPICSSPIDSFKRDELIQDYSTKIESNKNKISNLNSLVKVLLKDKQVLKDKYSNISAINIDVLKEQLSTLKEGQQDIKLINDNIKKLKTQTSLLKQLDNQIKEKKEALKDLKPKYEEYLSAKGSLESLGDQKTQQNNLKKIQENIISIKEEIKQLIEIIGDIKDLEGEIKELEDMKDKYQHLLGAVALKESLLNRIKTVQNSVNSLELQIPDLQLEIENISYDNSYHNKIIQDIESENQKLIDLKGKKQELIGKESGIITVLKDLENKLESYKIYQNDIRKLKDFIKLLNYIRDIYSKDGIQKDLRNISRPLIEQNTREFFERFNFEYSDIKLDNDYNVTVYGPGGESNLDMISGGEKIAVALALRLGITQTLSRGNLELIMLDEPTIHLDTYRRQELIDLLKRMSIIPQMIIVTHDSDLEDAADNIIKVIKEKGESKII